MGFNQFIHIPLGTGMAWTGWPVNWPLWQQIGLAGAMLLLLIYWLRTFLSSISWGWLGSRGGRLLKYALGAFLLSYFSSSFCIGETAPANPVQWGFYGRMLLMGQTAFFTSLFARYYS